MNYVIVINPDDRQARIADAAYYRYTLRGYEPGCALDDWLWAEDEVDRELLEGCICPCPGSGAKHRTPSGH